MDDGTNLRYFASDHLSSTSIVMNNTGGLLSQNRYMPFGQVRDITGSLDPINETDFTYTGQRNLATMGLMDYKARFYSPTLGRFTQPDTIVPNPGNPQYLNRFTYVLNNPIKYIDPTGHLTMCELDSSMCDIPQMDEADSVIKETTLYYKTYQIVEEYGHSLEEPNPNANDCEGMCQIVEYAAKIYHDDPNEFIDQLTYIFNGVVELNNPANALWEAYKEHTFEAIGRAPRADGSGYYFIDSGFLEKFRDHQNQLFHVWPFIVSTGGSYRYLGEGISTAGNIWHEITDDDPTGKSWEDFILGIEGMKIGTEWWMKGRDPKELAEIMREHLCK